MSWVRVEHPAGFFGQHYNSADWLADHLNQLGADKVHVVEHDRKNGIFEAVAHIPKVAVHKDDQGNISVDNLPKDENGVVII